MTPEQEKLLRDVHTAIVGNESIGHEGLVSRVNKVEAYQNKDRKFKNKLAGGVSVGGPILLGIYEWIKYKFI